MIYVITEDAVFLTAKQQTNYVYTKEVDTTNKCILSIKHRYIAQAGTKCEHIRFDNIKVLLTKQ